MSDDIPFGNPEHRIGDAVIVDNRHLNRVQIFFSRRPNKAKRRQLVATGFRWHQDKGAWQRFRSERTLQGAKVLLGRWHESATRGVAPSCTIPAAVAGARACRGPS